MVENEGRTAIRASEWFLWMRDEREKSKVKSPTRKPGVMGHARSTMVVPDAVLRLGISAFPDDLALVVDVRGPFTLPDSHVG